MPVVHSSREKGLLCTTGINATVIELIRGRKMKQISTSVATETYGNHDISFKKKVINDFKRNKALYLMLLPVLAFYIIFMYSPMYGAIIAFKDYSPMKGVLDSPWIGFKNFTDFIGDPYFVRIVSNTLILSVSNLIFGFPMPIILALLMNELKNRHFKKVTQTITYLPYFISLVVVCGLIKDFTSSDGIINSLLQKLGYNGQAMLQDPSLFRPIYILSEIWQRLGWDSIIYLAALSGIDFSQYEAARIDGAGRFKQLLFVTLPGMLPTVVIMLILRIGGLLNVGFEKVILLYNPLTYQTADIISTYVYRKGIVEFSWSFSTAVGLFNSVISFILLISANRISRKITQNSLW
jgi:putative aldouronate transport system permease protein